MKKRKFLKIVGVGITTSVIGVIAKLKLKWPSRSVEMPRELIAIRTLEPGDPVPQLFTVKVPIRGYKPGEQVGFEIVNLDWPHPFWQIAVVTNGYAVCAFAVGCAQDVGKTYKITGFRISANVSMQNGELKDPIMGVPFFGPSFHRRV